MEPEFEKVHNVVPRREPTKEHPIVEVTRREARASSAGEFGMLYVCYGGQAVRMRVTRECLNRGLSVVDSLFKLAESKGYRIIKASDRHGTASVQIDSEKVEVSLAEEYSRSPHLPTKHELERSRRYGYPRIPKYDYKGSGIFTLYVEANFGKRYTRREGRRGRLEDRLEEMLSVIEQAAGEAKVISAERERERLKWEAEERRRVAEARREEEERNHGEALADHVRRWKHAKDIRSFVAEMRTRLPTVKKTELLPEVEAWLSWAEKHAEKTDPITRIEYIKLESPEPA